MNFAILDTLDATTLGFIAAGLAAVWLGFWIIYRVIRSAVRAGVREAGLGGSRGIPFVPRKEEDSAHDFVYTEPRY